MASLQNVLQELYQWASGQDFIGHDPHDVLTSPFLRGIKEGERPWNSLARLVALQLGRRSIVNLHTILRVPHSENPKTVALFIMGLLRVRDEVTPNWKAEAQKLGERLLMSIQKEGGWGYTFPWQSRTHFLPANTPNIVTTSFAATALLELYELEPSRNLLDAIRKAAAYISTLKSKVDAFGYAKNDPQIVFNASLLGAEYLMKVGKLLSNYDYMESARHAALFVADRQREDGGWDYGLEKSQQWTDSFHTGFTIISMKSIADAIEEDHLTESALRGFEYYRKIFLQPDYAIAYFPGKRYPIDAHALGQAMVTFETFHDHESALRIAEWSIGHMRSNKGYFYYQRHQMFTNTIPYMRWSNAWMFRGLSSLVACPSSEG